MALLNGVHISVVYANSSSKIAWVTVEENNTSYQIDPGNFDTVTNMLSVATSALVFRKPCGIITLGDGSANDKIESIASTV